MTVQKTLPSEGNPGPSSSSSAFSCCKSVENTSVDGDSVAEDSQGNNNTMFHSNQVDASGHPFPKRPPVDIEFRDIRYTVKSFSFAKRKFGKFNFYYKEVHSEHSLLGISLSKNLDFFS